jgi:drug/metabolite transporter (DMT)-like permease
MVAIRPFHLAFCVKPEPLAMSALSQRRVPVAVAVLALVASAVAMGASPVFVRWGGVGPFTGAFWRVFLALAPLYLWARLERGRNPGWVDRGWTRATFLSGGAFAGDLFFWHLSIFGTTIANATLLSCLAPVWVVAFSRLFIGETVTRKTLIGLVTCIAGAVWLVGSGLSVSPEHLLGDLYGVGTSVFFGLYFLAVRVARREAPAGVVLFRSTVVTAAILAVIAGVFENAWLPMGVAGALSLLAMAWVSHVGGQGLLAFALGHLSAAFSSLVIFLEAVAGAFFGWAFFHEAVGLPQLLGGGAILAGIWIARPGREPNREPDLGAE